MTVRRSFLLLSENGKTLSRTYEIVGGNETLSELLFKEENKVDHFMEYLFGTDSDKISKFSTGTLMLNESSENYKDCDFDADTAKNCIRRFMKTPQIRSCKSTI